ncbi:hypothetical protein NLJ89_g11743 [Agrocybe chaxingu]|uniref:Uncharacterized protein n=1 Tax=Agrocybe chaxingu TaxID=84603 RepID=A0A9W8MMR8_9AGAR|nr:hypothetical protein NLJ89_g11743 [Agrocybe chaxingu]
MSPIPAQTRTSARTPSAPKYPPYPRPPPAPTYSYSRPSTSQPSYLTTENIHPVASNGTHYQQSYPPLSPDSAGSPAAESSTPPPSTPGLQAPSPSVELQTRVESPSKVLSPPDVNYYERTSKETSRKSKFQALIKAPFGGRPRPPDSNSSRRHRTSPTAATPDSYTSPSSASSTIIFVTADSERYVTVSISGAKTAAQIRELILTKLNLFHEDELHPYSIYQTEIGSFAIGEPLSNDKLWALCRDHSDSKGSLKFFVSIASSTVHEPPPPAPPMEYSSSPPVLPPLANINPLRVKRRSRSRNGSISSMSDNVPLDIGYDADLDNPDRDQNKSTPRLPVHQTATIIPSSSAPAGHPPSPRRRPSIVQHARPASPLIQSPEQATPPGQSSERTWSQRKEDGFGIGHGLPPVPATAAPPPPLSPNRPSFSSYEEASGLAVPYSRLLHVRSGSDAGAEREMALRASEVHADAVTKQLRRDSPSSGKLRAEPSRDNLRDRLGRRVFDEDDPSWEPVPTPTASGTRLADDSDRFPTTLSRSTRVPTIARHRPTFPPRPPASQLAPSMQDTRPSTQPRSGRQPIPTNYFVTWKGEEGGRRASPASPSTWGSSSRLAKTSTKSMDNLKLSSSSSSTSRRNAQLPMTRQTGNMPYSPSGLTLSGVPKSYDPPRGSSFAKPLPAQASPHGTSPDFGQSVSSQYVSRGGAYSSNLISPSQDPIPRPQSATGDAVTSPTSRGYPRLQSPHQYGSTLDSGESNRSPRAHLPQQKLPFG